MKPENFEALMRRELDQREIQPQKDSWKRLEKRLDQNKRDRGSRRWWFLAAAVVVAGFLVSGFFQQLSLGDKPIVVDREKNIPEALQEEQRVEPQDQVQDQAAPAMASTELREPVHPIPVLIKRADAVPLIVSDLAVPNSSIPGPRLVPRVSNEEIDLLLQQAMAELEQKSETSPGEILQANALLQEVERELDRSFRQQIFEVLKQGYSKARTAIADGDL